MLDTGSALTPIPRCPKAHHAPCCREPVGQGGAGVPSQALLTWAHHGPCCRETVGQGIAEVPSQALLTLHLLAFILPIPESVIEIGRWRALAFFP